MKNEDLPIFDAAILRQRLQVYDEAFLSEMYEAFLTQVADMKSVLVKLEKESITDYREVLSCCHRIKSSSLAVGALRLADFLQLTEDAINKHSPDISSYFFVIQLLSDYTDTAVRKELVRIDNRSSA